MFEALLQNIGEKISLTDEEKAALKTYLIPKSSASGSTCSEPSFGLLLRLSHRLLPPYGSPIVPFHRQL